ncbi:hypothetical protein CRUP_020815 [Coryphaenoides rupestris]|nr:hypothetical protein CRUP_020815 [Coryphaenoides rupestris]
MSYHHHHQQQQQHYQRRAMSSAERSATPVNKSATPTHKSTSSSSSSQRDSRQEADSWEIIEGLKIGQSNRFFVLDNGLLKYSKSPIDIQKGKLHGSIDVGLSVMSIKKRAHRIDLDTEEHIYHLKLRHHRLYRQNEIVRSPRDATIRMFPPPPPPPPAPAPVESPQAPPPAVHEVKAKPSHLPWQPVAPSSSSSSLPASYSNGQSKVAAWLQESEEMDKCAEELARCQSSLMELSKLLQSLEILQRTQSAPNFTDMQTNCVELSKKEKRLSRRWRTKSVGKDAKFQLEVPLSSSMSPLRLHSSNPNLCAELLVDFQAPPPPRLLTDSAECTGDYIKLQEDFCTIAQKAFNTVAIQKEKIKQILSDQEQGGQSVQINTLRKSLSQALSQNTELRTRLSRIHSDK